LGKAMAGLLPSIVLEPSMLVSGLVLAIIVGFASGVIPGVSAMRLRVVNALRRV
jgi:ABC-type lipoprotein release transport system permease subunit